jgi:hypothetical protein
VRKVGKDMVGEYRKDAKCFVACKSTCCVQPGPLICVRTYHVHTISHVIKRLMLATHLEGGFEPSKRLGWFHLYKSRTKDEDVRHAL